MDFVSFFFVAMDLFASFPWLGIPGVARWPLILRPRDPIYYHPAPSRVFIASHTSKEKGTLRVMDIIVMDRKRLSCRHLGAAVVQEQRGCTAPTPQHNTTTNTIGTPPPPPPPLPLLAL